MKAIIIAAGLGSRLGKATETLPKCLLTVHGQTVLDYQLCALRDNGITETVLVTGHQAEKLSGRADRTYYNADFAENNILESLMTAADEMNDGFIASYSDILYGPEVVKALLDAPGDIVLTIDTEWQDAYVGRTKHPTDEAEKVILNPDKTIQALGKHLSVQANNMGEFIGLFKCTAHGAKRLKQAYCDAQNAFANRSFHQAAEFKKAYITDLFTELLAQGTSIHTACIQGQWIEIDTPQDLLRAQSLWHVPASGTYAYE